METVRTFNVKSQVQQSYNAMDFRLYIYTFIFAQNPGDER